LIARGHRHPRTGPPRRGPTGPVPCAVSHCRHDRGQPVLRGGPGLPVRAGTARLRSPRGTTRHDATDALPAVLLPVRGLQRGHLPALYGSVLLRFTPGALVAGRAVGPAGRGDAAAGRLAPGAVPDGLGPGAPGGRRLAHGPAAPGRACPRRTLARAVPDAAPPAGPRRAST